MRGRPSEDEPRRAGSDREGEASADARPSRWEASINDELEAIARERHQPLVRERESRGDKADGALLPPTPSGTPLRFLFDSEDLLDAIAHVESPNRSAGGAGAPGGGGGGAAGGGGANAAGASGGGAAASGGSSSLWGLVKLQLHTEPMRRLRQTFSELHPSKRQYGLDEKLGDPGADRFCDEWHALGKRCLANGHVPLARRYARRGVPPSLRPQIYRVLLGLPHVDDPQGCSEAEKAYYAALKTHVDKVELVTDELFQMDVQHVADNDYYFPFEEALGNVVLAFSRDAWVLHNSAVRTHAPLAAKHAEPTDNAHWRVGSAVPPCAVQPFRGFVSYTAPLTFVYEQEEPMFYCLRAMYARFWCKLNVMRTAKSTLLPLCKLFEQLVIEHHPRLFFYLVQIGVDPLAVALPWIQFGFVGLLDVDQVLLLWDRVLGFEDLSLLPILAAAIFVYRSEKLLTANSLDDVKDMFSDGSILQVVPLIQTFLFCGPSHGAPS